MCTAEYLVASLASTHQMSVASSFLVVTIKNVCRHCQIGRTNSPNNNHYSRIQPVLHSQILSPKLTSCCKSLQFYFQPYLTISVISLWCLCVYELLSHVRLSATPWTVAPQASLSIEFSRQEYWNGLSFPSPGIFPTQELNPGLLHCRQIIYHQCLCHLSSS